MAQGSPHGQLDDEQVCAGYALTRQADVAAHMPFMAAPLVDTAERLANRAQPAAARGCA